MAAAVGVTIYAGPTLTSLLMGCFAWLRPIGQPDSPHEVLYRQESRMREIRTYGSEGGGAQANAPFLPLSHQWHQPSLFAKESACGCLAALARWGSP